MKENSIKLRQLLLPVGSLALGASLLMATLRGPVRSEDEKNNIQAKAAEVVGQENVTNQLEIAPSR